MKYRLPIVLLILAFVSVFAFAQTGNRSDYRNGDRLDGCRDCQGDSDGA